MQPDQNLTLTPEELAQVGQHWAAYGEGFSAQEHWTGLPAVKSRINRKITGNADTDLFGYVIHKYFLSEGRTPENCLSLGCGNGDLERGLTQHVLPVKHVGIELSESLVSVARERTAEFPHIEYRQDDLNICELEQDEYDLVIAHQSLHHVSNLEGLYDRIKHAMRPGAVFLFDEYIGPARFQWTTRQLECINAISRILPSELNRDVKTGLLRSEVFRCTPEQVMEVDPSEAIRSDQVVPLADRYFQIIEYRPYGGTLLHMLLHMKAGNFLDERGRHWLDVLFQLEDLLLPELGSDFAAVICR